MPLNDTAIRNAKPSSKPLKLTDGAGLYLLLTPKGGKWWRLDYRFGGKRKTLSMGVYPDVGLKAARDKRDAARKQVASGIDPADVREAARKTREGADANSFEGVGREWFAKYSTRWTDGHAAKVLRRLELNVFPWTGSRPIGEINAPDLLTILRRIESRGAPETAHRVLQMCGQIFRYAVATGRADRDPSGDLRGALSPVQQSHYAAITDPKRIGDLLRSLDGYEGAFATKCALRLAPLVFVRPGELRQSEWAEIDLDAGEWRIPADKMKSRVPHRVPLSRQALEILRELRPLTGLGRYVFPSIRTNTRPMSNNTVNAALRRLGYAKEEMTGHGFRSIASTLLNERGWNRDAIERQLAHGERDSVRAAYNHAEHMPERRRMMQEWADYLDTLKVSAEIVPIKKTG